MLERIRQPRLDTFAHDDPVDHDFKVMLVFLVECGRFIDLVEHPVDAHAGVARFLPLEQFLAIFALAPTHDGREEE